MQREWCECVPRRRNLQPHGVNNKGDSFSTLDFFGEVLVREERKRERCQCIPRSINEWAPSGSQHESYDFSPSISSLASFIKGRKYENRKREKFECLRRGKRLSAIWNKKKNYGFSFQIFFLWRVLVREKVRTRIEKAKVCFRKEKGLTAIWYQKQTMTLPFRLLMWRVLCEKNIWRQDRERSDWMLTVINLEWKKIGNHAHRKEWVSFESTLFLPSP